MPFAHCRNLKKDCSVNPHPQPFSQWEKGERLKSVTDQSQACDFAIQASPPHPTSPKGRGDVRKPDTSLQSRRIYQRRRIDRRLKRKQYRRWHSLAFVLSNISLTMSCRSVKTIHN